jgi:tetratricopeptide (TPR) repeat protein
MTTSYLDAIKINNNGVSQLEAGRFVHARNEFKSALDTIKEAVVQAQKGFECNTNYSSKGNSVTFRWGNNPAKHPQHIPIESVLVSIDSSFVYKRALRISPTDTGPSESTLSEESAAIVYNLALAYHLMGLEGAASLLEKSLKFYQIAFAINVRKGDSSHSNKLTGGVNLINLAILNNSGQINHELLDYAASRQCFRLLSSRLHLLSNFGFQGVLEENDCKGFILNLMLSEPDIAAAA